MTTFSEGLSKKFSEHTASDDRNFSEINAKLSAMKDNHLFHIEKSMAALEIGITKLNEKMDTTSVDTAKNTTNINWIMKIGGVIGTVVVVEAVAIVFKFIFK